MRLTRGICLGELYCLPIGVEGSAPQWAVPSRADRSGCLRQVAEHEPGSKVLSGISSLSLLQVITLCSCPE